MTLLPVARHFHDSVQTPGYPHGDGDCAAPGCDVGKALPIGAYLFNPAAANTSVRGQTFTEWFVDDYLFGPNGGSNPNISGFFFDDQFNPDGATESEGNLAHLGLSKAQGAQVSEYYWCGGPLHSSLRSCCPGRLGGCSRSC